MRSEARGWRTPAVVECLGKKERQRAVKLEVTQRMPLLKYPSGG